MVKFRVRDKVKFEFMIKFHSRIRVKFSSG